MYPGPRWPRGQEPLLRPEIQGSCACQQRAMKALRTGGFGCWIDLQNRVGGTDEPTIFALLLPKGTQDPNSGGGIAQLARALAWHARGPGFESPYLHQQPATGIMILAP